MDFQKIENKHLTVFESEKLFVCHICQKVYEKNYVYIVC